MDSLDIFTCQLIISFTDIDSKLCMRCVCSYWRNLINIITIKQFSYNRDSDKFITIERMFKICKYDLIGYGALNNSMKIIKYAISTGECDYNLGLEIACKNKNIQIIRFMINNGASESKKAFFNAYENNSTEIIDLLERSFKNELTLLEKFSAACCGGNIKNITEILKISPVYKQFNFYGNGEENNREYINFMCAGMSSAIEGNHFAVVKLLLQKFDEDSKNSIVDTSDDDNCIIGGDLFSYACAHANLEIVKYLYERIKIFSLGVFQSHVRDGIHDACDIGNIDVVKFIFNNIDTLRLDFDSLIDSARNSGNHDTIEYITDKYESICGVPPEPIKLRDAMKYCNIEFVEECLKRGERREINDNVDSYILKKICINDSDIIKLLVDYNIFNDFVNVDFGYADLEEIFKIICRYCDREIINYVQGKIGYLLRLP